MVIEKQNTNLKLQRPRVIIDTVLEPKPENHFHLKTVYVLV